MKIQILRNFFEKKKSHYRHMQMCQERVAVLVIPFVLEVDGCIHLGVQKLYYHLMCCYAVHISLCDDDVCVMNPTII